ncbi:hypothetical protein A5882_003778 [Enterococcus sp. 4E1_DIV0656]|uniref:C39 family peptidase n=1 Tax=Enterococcus sp. 4E1_DIV0656 TaxID=1834180 RepID=UPI000B6BDF88|nr:C39 family peptidase [Enterococcus sp. 4E1_DIV0656]OTO08306.1 hypothetical protein A5882_003778 [Enterococcus sp. 4E1_DIV0656]
MKIKFKRFVITSCAIGTIIFVLFFDYRNGLTPFPDQLTATIVAEGDELSSDEHLLRNDIRLDVPLINQFEPIHYQNACEIAALTMLANYYGYQVDISDLIELLAFQPLFIDNDHHGDPRLGFVGNIYKGYGAMGVDVEPIAEVAKQIFSNKHHVISGREKPFDQLLDVLRSGTPIWIIATLELQIPTENDFISWYTKAGEIKVTPLVHSVILTGIEGETIYVNDPYGYKDRSVSLESLELIYTKMGEQYLFVSTNSDSIDQ